LARQSKNVNQGGFCRWLRSGDGMDRGSAKIGGMDRQTPRDWVHRFNASAPEGLIDNQTGGPEASPIGGAIDPVRTDRRGRAG
jgi:hypothetical protein